MPSSVAEKGSTISGKLPSLFKYLKGGMKIFIIMGWDNGRLIDIFFKLNELFILMLFGVIFVYSFW